MQKVKVNITCKLVVSLYITLFFFIFSTKVYSSLTSEYFPLAVGNTWILKNSTTGETSTAAITGTQTFKDKSAFVCNTTYSNHPKAVNTDYYSKSDTELLSSFGTEGWITVLKFPSEQGNKWDNIFSNSKSTLTIEVIGKEEITVLAGTFKCYRIKATTVFNTKESIKINKVNIWFALLL